MEDQEQTGNGKGPTAPYISFQTIKTITKDMKEHGVPSRIDRSVFATLSGGVIGQLLPALKFLHLTDDNGTPTPEMHSLVGAFGTDQWPTALNKVICAAYGPLFSMNLELASPRQFDEKFRDNYAGTEEVGRKSKTFFLNAAQECGIKISAYITKGKKSRVAPTKRRPIKQNGNHAAVVRDELPPPPPLATTNKLPSEIVLGFLSADMGEPEQNAVWTLLKYFRAQGK